MRTGGIESMINSLANEMCNNHDVSVCSVFKPSEKWTPWSNLDKRIKKYSLGKTSEGFSLREVFQIFVLIKKEKFDIVHVHGFFVYYMLSVLFLHRKTKFVYTVHSDAVKENTRWDKKFYCLKKCFFRRRFLNPVTISPTSQQSFFEYYRCDSSLISNGINEYPNSYETPSKTLINRIDNNTTVFINVGRIDTPKNQILLCKVFTDLISKGKDVMLYIAGPKTNQGIYEEMEPMFCNRIIYLGEISNAQEVFAQCDAMVMPSLWEGLPVTLLESMSVGCIPICSPAGGMKDVIKSGENGFLSLSAEFEDFENTVSHFLDMSPEEKQNMKYKARRTIQQEYSIKNTAKDYLNLYNQILAQEQHA